MMTVSDTFFHRQISTALSRIENECMKNPGHIFVCFRYCHLNPMILQAHSIVSKTNWFKWVVVLMKVQSTNKTGTKRGIWIFFKYWHYTLGICNTYIFDMIYADMLLLLLNCMVGVWLRRKKKIQTTKNACTLLDWTEIAWKTLNIFRFRKSLIDSRRFRGKDRVLLLLNYFHFQVKLHLYSIFISFTYFFFGYIRP